MQKVRMGVIGLGGMGQAHLNSIREVPAAELTAVSDVDSETAKKISDGYEVPAFSNYEELLKSDLIDAVSIATPHYLHPEIGIKAMENGIHCLCEKPIAVSVAAADEFLQAAKVSGVVFGVMHQH